MNDHYRSAHEYISIPYLVAVHQSRGKVFDPFRQLKKWDHLKLIVQITNPFKADGADHEYSCILEPNVPHTAILFKQALLVLLPVNLHQFSGKPYTDRH